MRVRDLIEQLEVLDLPDAQVYIAEDDWEDELGVVRVGVDGRSVYLSDS